MCNIDEYIQKISGFDEVITSLLEERNSKIPGLGVGVYFKDRFLYCKGFGYADLENKIRVDGKTVFRLASISKLFTTIAIMQFWEQGMFHLDDAINDYLPNDVGHLIKKYKDWPKITFKHLLTHQSGIGELPRKRDVLKAPGFGLNNKWPEEIPPLKWLLRKDIIPEVAVEQKYCYCNFAFAILGFLIEIFSGMDFRDYVKEEILDPLEMHSSDFIRTDDIIKKESEGYYLSFFRKKLKKATYFQGIMKSAGNLYSNLEDMGNFSQMLIQMGSFKGKQILKSETLKLCWQPHYAAHPLLVDNHSIGLCFNIYNVNKTKIIGHTGLLMGHTSGYFVIPSKNLAICVFSNLGEIFHADQTQRIKNIIIQKLLNIDKSQYKLNPMEKKANFGSRNINNKNINGIYGPYKGILTNFRIYQLGGEFSVRFKKDGLFLKGLYGPYRRGKQLFETKNPKIFYYPTPDGGFIHPINKVVIDNFSTSQNQGLHFAWNLYRLPKKSFRNSLKTKILVSLVLFIFVGLWIIL